jgi:hypothetical protein
MIALYEGALPPPSAPRDFLAQRVDMTRAGREMEAF